MCGNLEGGGGGNLAFRDIQFPSVRISKSNNRGIKISSLAYVVLFIHLFIHHSRCFSVVLIPTVDFTQQWKGGFL